MSYPNKQNMAGGAIPVWLANPSGGSPNPGLSMALFEQVTDLSSAVVLEAPEGYTNAYAVVQVNAGVVRYRQDDVEPTATVGMLLYATGPSLVLAAGATLEKTSFIQNTGSTGSLNVEWWGVPAS